MNCGWEGAGACGITANVADLDAPDANTVRRHFLLPRLTRDELGLIKSLL